MHMTVLRTRGPRRCFVSVAAGLALVLFGVPTVGAERTWHYEDTQVVNWRDAFPACGGDEQSPIDLKPHVRAILSEVAFNWKSAPAEVVNNGHTIQVNLSGGAVTLGGTVFRLGQFHFHSPSEHTLRGKAMPMEAHFVHQAEDGSLAVVGVFIVEGAANPALEPILNGAPAQEGSTNLSDAVDPSAFLPLDGRLFRYAGSLTTPPCTEIVTWTVYATPIEASKEQIGAFRALYDGNARPVQPLNRRYLLSNFE